VVVLVFFFLVDLIPGSFLMAAEAQFSSNPAHFCKPGSLSDRLALKALMPTVVHGVD